MQGLAQSDKLLHGLDVQDVGDFIFDVAFGGVPEPIGAEELAQAIVAGGWTWDFCGIMNFDCPYY